MTRTEIKNLRTEGSRGLQDLAKLAEALGCGGSFGQLQLNNGCFVSSITTMLEDNPGMIEAIYSFVLDHEKIYEIEEKDFDDDTGILWNDITEQLEK